MFAHSLSDLHGEHSISTLSLVWVALVATLTNAEDTLPHSTPSSRPCGMEWTDRRKDRLIWVFIVKSGSHNAEPCSCSGTSTSASFSPSSLHSLLNYCPPACGLAPSLALVVPIHARPSPIVGHMDRVLPTAGTKIHPWMAKLPSPSMCSVFCQIFPMSVMPTCSALC